MRGGYSGKQRKEEARNRYKQVPYMRVVIRVNKEERKPGIDTSNYLIWGVVMRVNKEERKPGIDTNKYHNIWGVVIRVNKEERKPGIDTSTYHISGGGYDGKQSRDEARNRYKQYLIWGVVWRLDKEERKPGIDTSKYHKWAMAWDFQQCGILTCVDSDEPLQPTFKLRISKGCLVSTLTIIEYSSG